MIKKNIYILLLMLLFSSTVSFSQNIVDNEKQAKIEYWNKMITDCELKLEQLKQVENKSTNEAKKINDLEIVLQKARKEKEMLIDEK